MSAEVLLRGIAITIAVAGAIDPALTRDLAVRRQITVAVVDDGRLPSGAWSSVEQLRTALAGDYEVAVDIHRPGSRAAACPADGGCILVSTGSAPSRVTSGADVIGAVRLVRDGDSKSIIRNAKAPGTVFLNGAAALEIQLQRRAEVPSEVRVFDEGALVGRAIVEGPPSEQSAVQVEWVPLAAGARRLRVVVGPVNDTVIDDEIDIGVHVQGDAASIVMYEPEPTWLGTFVRRALTADPRFRFDARTRLAPAITVGSDGRRELTAGALADASVVVVTAPESLSPAEIQLLDRFASVRGGSVILLPDRRPSGSVTRLMPAVRGEHREPSPKAIGSIRASEFIEFDVTRGGSVVLERADGCPVIVGVAWGRGRIITSGALDAWRFRDEGTAFDRFWASLTAAAAVSGGEPLHLDLRDALVEKGTETELSVEWRTLDYISSRITAYANAVCEDGSRVPIRLWPAARPGAFTGLVSSDASGRCTIQGAITDPFHLTASTPLLVAEQTRVIPPAAALESTIAAHGGLVVNPGNESTLVTKIRERIVTERKPQETRPMHSLWWIAAFTAVLGAEWWLRRHRGRA